MRIIGEEHVFGIDKGHLETFLLRRGFYDVHNADAEGTKAPLFYRPQC
jgi:hypothetical protein